VTLVAVVREMDPRRALTSSERYNTLPGFTARIRVVIAYLESALTYLGGGDEFDLRKERF
jgi:hypothetical protein